MAFWGHQVAWIGCLQSRTGGSGVYDLELIVGLLDQQTQRERERVEQKNWVVVGGQKGSPVDGMELGAHSGAEAIRGNYNCIAVNGQGTR